MTTDRNFQVNLGGIIKLLSDHLYSGPEVFLRELLQNSVDAITGRKHLDPDREGHIRIEVMGTGLKATIMFEDNGTGLTEEEVHQFLATIGESSKAADLNRDDFIGQFGIGLLSGFLVSSELTVVSQSIRPDSKPVEWTGREDGTYGVRTLDSSIDPGTRVFLRPKSGREEFFDADRVEQLLRHFGHHLPHKVELVANEIPRKINETPPWRERFVSAREQREVNLTYGQSVFDIDFMDAIPLKSSAGQVAGVAYVLEKLATVRPQSVGVRIPQELSCWSRDGKYDPAALGLWFRNEAQQIADRFNQRNGNKMWTQTLTGYRELVGLTG